MVFRHGHNVDLTKNEKLMSEWIPSPKSLVKLALGIAVIFAVTDLVGGKNWLIAPISSWRNRNAA
jgi:hypothetical protein